MKHLPTIVLIYCTALIGCTAHERPPSNIEQTKIKAKEALQFCKAQKFNTDFCILVDMSQHSGLNRFIVWDFEKNIVSYSCLVSHGCCDKPWSKDDSKDNPRFSNVDGSHCSSLGKYRIGGRGISKWGVRINYALHGLESSNRNANRRTIVFHSWKAVKDHEVYPKGTPEGWGCPAISNNSFKIIDPKLKSSAKPVLMWIYQ